MEAIGNVLNIVGLLVTLVAYVVEHRGRRLGELFPPVLRAWRRTRAWLRKLARRPDELHTVTATRDMAWTTASAEQLKWLDVPPEDALAVRIEKVNENLDALRTWATTGREEDQKAVRIATQALTATVVQLRSDFEDSQETDRAVTTRAMGWQVAGLGVALVGALMSALG